MKKYTSILSFLVLLLLVAFRFYDLVPQTEYAPENFSTEKTLQHIKNIAEKPHFVGSEAHEEVKQYILTQLEEIGLNPEIQKGFTSGDWGNVSYAQNIIAKIEGSGSGKALVLMAHFDSNPHSSLGASDDGVGVAVILEAVRNLVKTQENPKNDIIILFTDGEELGLNGAQLFVDKHPLAKEIGLILNLEARGSGGPSYMLIETNGGNKNLITSFAEAHPQFPVANSLAYSIYKMLPNDTDLTVFREHANIDGFNFAFIDDHFDYHTVNDSYENVDSNTLQHQISYVLPLLDFYKDYDLTTLKSDTDYIYFDIPVFNFVYYPFAWIFPMLIIAFVLFIVLLVVGIKNKTLLFSGIARGFLAFIVCLLLAGALGFFSWQALLKIYPHYQDILHGFTYNGHFYIASFSALSFAICFYVYSRFTSEKAASLLIAPLFFWLLICTAIATYLEGASFFIIPVFGALASLFLLINQKGKKRTPLLFLLFLCVPALWILAPLIQMFPVGLGLKILIASCLLSVLLFGLLLPVFSFYNNKKNYAHLGLLIAVLFFISAHFQSSVSEKRPHPTSLLYVLDVDNQQAQWATYNKVLDFWTAQFIDLKENTSEEKIKFSSKYGTKFTHVASAPVKNIPAPEITIERDSVWNGKRHVTVCVTPQRNVNRLEIFTDNTTIEECSLNGVSFSENFLKRRDDRLLTYYISNNHYSELTLVFDENEKPVLTFYEASNDLLNNPQFSVPSRPKNAIPMPFVLNDAVMIKKTLKL
ncbi:M20/M25/M40 family metallo-hydrolase [Galbibacter mesophilus]|uniref:M20/M25/M40 family metallo-hydrolase n=1 Tax=Galbibacter mesophilus TaxID=379069 RepID=UPI00191C95D7|nr:M20/M25/M40 family metallo-hydrolase [Galbibacter mesophilus]MCM5661997.1 M20/M25/M40 family metallo-hydrolase [Galbibacter mesophilus]